MIGRALSSSSNVSEGAADAGGVDGFGEQDAQMIAALAIAGRQQGMKPLASQHSVPVQSGRAIRLGACRIVAVLVDVEGAGLTPVVGVGRVQPDEVARVARLVVADKMGFRQLAASCQLAAGDMIGAPGVAAVDKTSFRPFRQLGGLSGKSTAIAFRGRWCRIHGTRFFAPAVLASRTGGFFFVLRLAFRSAAGVLAPARGFPGLPLLEGRTAGLDPGADFREQPAMTTA